MKRFVLLTLSLLAFILPISAKNDPKAGEVLDKVSSSIAKSNGIEAGYTLLSNQGNASGTILLKGQKFRMDGGGITTWFDGKTQWTYIKANEEVNVSVPTKQELQNINPYAFLYMYKKGFAYKMGPTTKVGKQKVYEIVLNSTGKSAQVQITLLIDQATYQPLQIKMIEGNIHSVININSFKKKKLADSTFAFKKSYAPKAEIIDLR